MLTGPTRIPAPQYLPRRQWDGRRELKIFVSAERCTSLVLSMWNKSHLLLASSKEDHCGLIANRQDTS